MQQILVYADSLSWGIVPTTRRRLAFDQRWPGVLENALNDGTRRVRVIEDCLNGRRTVWDDPFKPGRNGLQGLAQRIEIHSPLALVVLMLGTNDFQSMHAHNAWHSAQGTAALVRAIREAPIEPKFEGGEHRCIGLAESLRAVCGELGCAFFDAGSLIHASPQDGVHVDAAQHAELGAALAAPVAALIAQGR